MRDNTSAVTHSIFENSSSSFFGLTDKGRFAGMGGTEGTENHKEGSEKSNVLLQFSEGEVQVKRLRLDPQEAREKTDLCFSVRKNSFYLLVQNSINHQQSKQLRNQVKS